MSKAVIAGGTGLVGRALVKRFEGLGWETVILSRSGKNGSVKWDGKNQGDWAKELDGADAVISLCGPSIFRPWTKSARKTILQGRIDPANAIGEAILSCKSPPKTWITASATGWYGDQPSGSVCESAPKGEGFLADTIAKLESTVMSFTTPGTSKTLLRIGVVLTPEGGALKMMAKQIRLYLGFTLGSGKQAMSWIHIDDLTRMIVWACDQSIQGPVNAVSPHPISMAEFMAIARKRCGRPNMPHVPAFKAKIVCWMLRWDSSFLLGGARVIPMIALGRGFKFEHTDLNPIIDSAAGIPKAWYEA
jgi:uncharacterized protein (TIGR01777 family)